MFKNSEGGIIVEKLILAIQENRDYLSEVDGKIGDGDHGVNMNKGFTMCASLLRERGSYSMSEAFRMLSDTLMDGIGGSMGPLYGMFFAGLSEVSEFHEDIDKNVFAAMLEGALDGVQDIGSARLGDKTLLDTLIPACDGFKEGVAEGLSFNESLERMTVRAEAGWKATEGMIAKIGRASRLGERSRGVLDAGATSCFIILSTMASAIRELNRDEA